MLRPCSFILRQYDQERLAGSLRALRRSAGPKATNDGSTGRMARSHMPILTSAGLSYRESALASRELFIWRTRESGRVDLVRPMISRQTDGGYQKRRWRVILIIFGGVRVADHPCLWRTLETPKLFYESDFSWPELLVGRITPLTAISPP